jgi:uncharacterized protein (TIGR02099 family)
MGWLRVIILRHYFLMTASALSPSRSLRFAAGTVRLLLWLLLLAWLVLALAWGALHLFIVPRIEQWRPRIEMQATKALGVPVKIGAMSAQSEGLIPSFELKDVVLLDPQGREALRLPRVVAALSPRSVLQMGFDQLYLEGPVLDIRRTPDGRLWVGGLDLSANQDAAADPSGMDWFFSQPEFVIRHGTVRWTDEMVQPGRGAPPPLALSEVEFVLRNPSIALARRHQFRLDATPPTDWGQRFTLSARLREPALAKHSGDWQEWSGEVHADFANVDVSQLRRYVKLDTEVTQGRGALRAWAEVERGQIIGVVADLGLNEVQARLGAQLEPLALQSIGGRLTWHELPGGFEFSTAGLQFRTQDGLQWPGGNVALSHSNAQGNTPQGELRADKLDMAALAQVANRLPLGTATHALLGDFQPKGRVESLQASWAGPVAHLKELRAKGQVSQLALASRASTGTLTAAQALEARLPPGRPGLRGANIDFELTLAGGRAKIDMDKGSLDFPGAFEEASIPIDKLSAQTQWTVKDERIELSVDQIKIANADLQADGTAKWKTSDPAVSRSKSRFPGVLDLSANLSQADATLVHRYLPASIPKYVREYVRNAVTQGTLSAGKIRIKGDLFDLPYADPKLGEFRIAANIKNADFAYAPQHSNGAGAPTWPALTQLNGELVFDRVSMQVKGASARVNGFAGLQIAKAEASIPSLLQSPTVVVNGEARGPVNDVLAFVKTSPLAGMTNNVLGQATASGNADYRIRLNLPLAELEKTRVQGSITLPGNDVQFTPGTPMLARARGQVGFSEKGFQITDAQAAMLGGEIRFEGGSRAGTRTQPENVVSFSGQGTASSEGMRAAKELGFLSRMAQNLSGSTPYAATLTFRQGEPELAVKTSMQGMAVTLPPPLAKPPETVLPLRYENSLVRDPKTNALVPGQDQLWVDWGRVASVYFLRDVSGVDPRVIRGGIGMGLEPGETAPAPEEGVVANINLAKVDLDAWQRLAGAGAAKGGAGAESVGAKDADSDVAQSYLPTVMAVRARELKIEGRTLTNVVVGGSREGLTWRANLDANELSGYVELRQGTTANPGRVYARLSRLTLAPAQAAEVERILEEQPTNIPALDIVVDDFDFKGKKLGRVEIDAVNRAQRDSAAREWRLNRLAVTMPEASFTASGNWAAAGASAAVSSTPGMVPTAAPAASGRRRTLMNFKFDVEDSGALLKRMGMDGVVRRGKGRMEGQVSWLGSPFALDYPSMSGQFNINMAEGQFLKADPGLAKLLGVLSLQSLPRRLTLDFRDVFSDGFAFDFVRGDVRIEQGVAITNNLQMKGVNAAVLMEGRADIAKETQDLHVVVVPEINAGTASVIATVINPAIGLGTFLAQLILRGPLIEATKQEFQIDGSWTDPKITKLGRKPSPSSTTPEDNRQ